MEELNGGSMLVRTLEELGVEHIFGYPGGAVLDIYDALLDSKKLRHIMARHEQGAAHAADGYARATGRVGVCLVTSGPGATNTVTAVATAYMDSIPMVLITGQVGTPLIGSDAFQEVDTVGITRPIVKHSYLCKSTIDIPVFLRRAFYLASSGRPGPVVVDIPKDCVRPALKFPYPPMQELRMRSYNPTMNGHRGQVKRAAKLLAEAQRPVLLAGGGAAFSGASEQLRALAARLKLPVTATLMGLGAYDGTDSSFLGMLGMHGTVEANRAVAGCDVLLAVGARFDDRVTNAVDRFCPQAKIIHIDIDPASIAKTVRADIPIVGDATTVLGQLMDALDESGDIPASRLDDWWAEIGRWRAEGLAAETARQAAAPAGVIMPQQVVRTVYEATHGEAIIATDVGQHQMFVAQYYPFSSPRRLLTSGGLGTMGYGLPAAMGAKAGCPDREVCLITGDGSVQMNIQELSCCLEFGLPLKIFILNNRTLGMVRQWQRMFYHGRISSTNLNFNPDFVALAKAYGHEGLRVERPEDLAGTVKKALGMRGKLVVVDIVCDTDALVLPMQRMQSSMDDMVLKGGL